MRYDILFENNRLKLVKLKTINLQVNLLMIDLMPLLFSKICFYYHAKKFESQHFPFKIFLKKIEKIELDDWDRVIIKLLS